MPRAGTIEAAARAANAHEFIVRAPATATTPWSASAAAASPRRAPAHRDRPRARSRTRRSSSSTSRPRRSTRESEALVQQALERVCRGPHDVHHRAPALDRRGRRPHRRAPRTAGSSRRGTHAELVARRRYYADARRRSRRAGSSRWRRSVRAAGPLGALADSRPAATAAAIALSTACAARCRDAASRGVCGAASGAASARRGSVEPPPSSCASRRRRDAPVLRGARPLPRGATLRMPGFPFARGSAVRVRPREPGVHRSPGPRRGRVERRTRGSSGSFRAEDRGVRGQVVVRGDRAGDARKGGRSARSARTASTSTIRAGRTGSRRTRTSRAWRETG